MQNTITPPKPLSIFRDALSSNRFEQENYQKLVDELVVKIIDTTAGTISINPSIFENTRAADGQHMSLKEMSSAWYAAIRLLSKPTSADIKRWQ